jgi:glycogen debranching enzyme
VITEKDPDWVYLAENYNYNFKNYPNQFHNGGSWPVMLGLFCAGLSQTNQNQLAKQINDEYNALIVASDNYQFHEYFDPVKGAFGGMKHMCFSASGWLLMQQSMKENKELSKLL